MSKKKHKRNAFFHIGKNIPKNDRRNTPFAGEPNTNLDTYDKRSGKLRRRRKFGKDGRAYLDMDAPHLSNEHDHAHDIEGSVRMTGRSFNKKERREFDKAKRKRRFWNDQE